MSGGYSRCGPLIHANAKNLVLSPGRSSVRRGHARQKTLQSPALFDEDIVPFRGRKIDPGLERRRILRQNPSRACARPRTCRRAREISIGKKPSARGCRGEEDNVAAGGWKMCSTQLPALASAIQPRSLQRPKSCRIAALLLLKEEKKKRKEKNRQGNEAKRNRPRKKQQREKKKKKKNSPYFTWSTSSGPA